MRAKVPPAQLALDVGLLAAMYALLSFAVSAEEGWLQILGFLAAGIAILGYGIFSYRIGRGRQRYERSDAEHL